MIGASIGGSVGKSMDDTDRLKVAHSLENIRTGVPSSWKNPDSQRRYTVIPTKTTETAQGPCREYSLEAVIGGKTEQIYGEACRQADGSWKIIK
jgi:surface antigen